MDPLQLYIERYFPNASAWPAKVQEDIYDADLDGIDGCHDVEGIAVDEDLDGTPDRFFFYRNGFKITSIISKRLGDILLPLTCEFEENKANKCMWPLGSFSAGIRFDTPVIKGRLFPDSFGRIGALAMLDGDMTEAIISQLLTAKPDLKFLLFDLQMLDVKTHKDADYEASSNVIHYPVDFIKALWVRDHLKTGRNELGLPFALDPLASSIDDLTRPVADEFGAMVYSSRVLFDGGNILTTSRNTFVHGFIHPLVEDELQQAAAYGNRIVTIDVIPSAAAHLDMVLTPLEERIDGKPVVVLARVTRLKREGEPDFIAEIYNRLFGDELMAMNSIGESLQGSFTIRVIPLVYSGEFTRTNPLPVGPPGDRPIAYSYNNILVERYVENGELIKRVYMPWYEGLDETNEIAKNVYEDMGYQVIKIKGLDAHVQFGGSLRCMTAVLDRY